jgi:hypothetical protein
MGYKPIAAEIKNLPGLFTGGITDTELAGKAEVLLKNKVIKPFKFAKYADFELSTLDQIRKVPKDMQARIVTLVNEKSYEGLFLPWLELMAPAADACGLLTEYFGLPPNTVSVSAGNGLLSRNDAQISPRGFDRELKADIFWKISKPIIGNRRLSIEIKPNRPLTRIPKLILCAGMNGQYLENYTDKNAKILMEIPERELEQPQMIFRGNYVIPSPMSSQLTKKSKFFLFLYGTSSVPNEYYILRWAEGFKGKA